MDYITNIIFGILASTISSLIFLHIVLTRLRPKVSISKCISHYKDFSVWGEKRYYLKFINCSIHPAYDVRLRLCELTRQPAGNGKMHEQRRDLTLRVSFLSHVPRFRRIGTKDIFAPHAIIITCLDDLYMILADDSKSVEFQVIARHGLTGLASVFSYEYSTSNVIKNGPFDFGNQLTIAD